MFFPVKWGATKQKYSKKNTFPRHAVAGWCDGCWFGWLNSMRETFGKKKEAKRQLNRAHFHLIEGFIVAFIVDAAAIVQVGLNK